MKLNQYIARSIKYKGISAFLVPLIIIVIFVSLYFPAKQKSSSMENVEIQLKTLCEMLAFSVGAGLNDGNFDLVQTAFNWIKKDPNVVYTAIIDENNQVLIEQNPQNYKVDANQIKPLEYNKDRNTLNNSINIVYKDKNFGKIVMMYSLEKASENISEGFWTAIIVSLLNLVLGSFLVIIIFNKIAKGIIQLRDAAKQASQGKMNVTIENYSQDEVGDLTRAFNQMLKNIETTNEALEKEKKSVEYKVENAVIESEEQKQYLSESVNKILAEIEKFADGDLTVELKVESNDEIGRLFQGFNRSVQNIKKMLTEVTQAVESTASASAQISSSSEEMASGSQEQSSQTSEIAVAVEEMTKTIFESTKNATTAAENSNKAKESVKKGAQKVEETKKGMERIVASAQETGKIISSLANKTDQIGEITQVIDDIADQTNLLALNAAIEAARAGEQGRGFAVVADEVRKLAERTTKATKEIADTIRTIQVEAKQADNSMEEARASVMNGMDLTKQVADVLKEIFEVNSLVSDKINQVAAASEEESATAEQISKNIESINIVTQQSAAGVQQIARAAADLNQLTGDLQNLIEQFKIDKQDSYEVRFNGKLVKTKLT